MHSYTHCNYCNGLLPEDFTLEMKHEHFLYCSVACRDKKAEERKAKRIQDMKSHHPWDRMTEAEREHFKEWLGTSGPVIWNELTFAAAGRDMELVEEEITDEDGTVKKVSKTVKKEKASRKCGKCGQSGHNARTCSAKVKK